MRVSELWFIERGLAVRRPGQQAAEKLEKPLPLLLLSAPPVQRPADLMVNVVRSQQAPFVLARNSADQAEEKALRGISNRHARRLSCRRRTKIVPELRFGLLPR